jgi:hypothetical protein
VIHVTRPLAQFTRQPNHTPRATELQILAA